MRRAASATGCLHELRTDSETIEIARTAHRELAATSNHRVPIPDLLISACAQQHQAAVLHLDRHYDTLARVLAFARAGEEKIALTPRRQRACTHLVVLWQLLVARSSLILPIPTVEFELVQLDRLTTGLATAGPTPEQWL